MRLAAVPIHTPRPASAPGRLIVLEGLDGAGTTTQARKLVEALRAAGHKAHLTREPSDGPIGRLIREMLTGGHAIPSTPPNENGDTFTPIIRPETFACLFAADRVDHLQREVGPALTRGEVVVSDRWYHSTYAYQKGDTAWLQTLNCHAWIPDVTIFLKVTPDVAAARRQAAGRTQELFEDIVTQRRVAQAYDATLATLAAVGEKIYVIDGENPLETVTSQVAHATAIEGLTVAPWT